MSNNSENETYSQSHYTSFSPPSSVLPDNPQRDRFVYTTAENVLSHSVAGLTRPGFTYNNHLALQNPNYVPHPPNAVDFHAGQSSNFQEQLEGHSSLLLLQPISSELFGQNFMSSYDSRFHPNDSVPPNNQSNVMFNPQGLQSSSWGFTPVHSPFPTFAQEISGSNLNSHDNLMAYGKIHNNTSSFELPNSHFSASRNIQGSLVSCQSSVQGNHWPCLQKSFLVFMNDPAPIQVPIVPLAFNTQSPLTDSLLQTEVYQPVDQTDKVTQTSTPAHSASATNISHLRHAPVSTSQSTSRYTPYNQPLGQSSYQIANQGIGIGASRSQSTDSSRHESQFIQTSFHGDVQSTPITDVSATCSLPIPATNSRVESSVQGPGGRIAGAAQMTHRVKGKRKADSSPHVENIRPDKRTRVSSPAGIPIQRDKTPVPQQLETNSLQHSPSQSVSKLNHVPRAITDRLTPRGGDNK